MCFSLRAEVSLYYVKLTVDADDTACCLCSAQVLPQNHFSRNFSFDFSRFKFVVLRLELFSRPVFFGSLPKPHESFRITQKINGDYVKVSRMKGLVLSDWPAGSVNLPEAD